VATAPGPRREPTLDDVLSELPRLDAGNGDRRRAPRPGTARRDGGGAADYDADLARERALIETARTALLRRDPQAASVALERHLERFPRGRLREERQALRVQAMAASGQAAQARALADEFRRLYPRSLLLPLVDGSVRGLK
jgi:hypothetical protein